jgi:hypothetical protein
MKNVLKSAVENRLGMQKHFKTLIKENKIDELLEIYKFLFTIGGTNNQNKKKI